MVYEAGPTGYGLHRELTRRAIAARSSRRLIPRRAGERIKTDRRDCARLAGLSRAGELKAIWVPDGAQEALRNLWLVREDAVTWHAINDILLWKLATAPESTLKLHEADIGRSLGEHLAPLSSPFSTAQSVVAYEMRAVFGALLEAQIELNEFVSRSADAFSYDDGIRFVRNEAVLEIEEPDPVARAAWSRVDRKLARLHEYWFYRALDEFAGSEIATRTIGRPENHEANRLAYIRAMRTRLQLMEVYGVAATFCWSPSRP